MLHKDALILIEEIGNQAYTPNEWETKFMDDISKRRNNLSVAQAACLQKIYEKATGGGVFIRKQHFS
jgi:hypothetical protein